MTKQQSNKPIKQSNRSLCLLQFFSKIYPHLLQYNNLLLCKYYILRIMNSNCYRQLKDNQIQLKQQGITHNQFSENDPLQSNRGSTKPLSSSRRLPKTKLHSFGSAKHKKSQPRRLSVKVGRLQSEKQELLESITLLRASAISAIAEKQDQILKMSQNQLFSSQEWAQFYQHQLQRCLVSQHELELSHNELEAELRQQSQYLSKQLAERQEKIQELYEGIVKMRNYINQLQENERQYREKIKGLQLEVEQLLAKVEEYSLRLSQISQPKPGLDQKKPLLGPNNVINSSQRGYLRQDEDLPQAMIEGQESIISQLRLTHEAQIKRLTKLFQHQLRQSNLKEYQCPILQILEPYSPRDQKQPSLHYTKQSKSQLQDKLQQILISEPPFLDLTSQPQPSIHNLREEISPLAESKDYEQLSQYTKEHSIMHYLFHKKKSSVHFEDTSTSNQMKLIQKQTNETEHLHAEIILQDEQKKVIENRFNPFWQKVQLFSTGFISGASVASLLSILFRSK